MAISMTEAAKSPDRLRLERLAGRHEELLALRAQHESALSEAGEHVRATKILADRARVRSLVEPSKEAETDAGNAAVALEAALLSRDTEEQEVTDLAMAIRDVEAEVAALRRTVYTAEENQAKARIAVEVKAEAEAVIPWVVKTTALGILTGSYQGHMSTLIEKTLWDAGWNSERLGRAVQEFIDTKVRVGRV